jgi:hypothetical protein
MEIKEYYAIVMVPAKIGFRTNATPKQLTDVAHEAATSLPKVDDYIPKLLEVHPKMDGELLTTPPIPPRAA